jgi:dTDP-glucose pyrophosphorylase
MIDEFLINESESIRTALDRLSKLNINGPVLFVINNKEELVGSLSDGDVRRGLLKEKKLDDKVISIAKSSFKFIDDNDDQKSLKFKAYKKNQIEIIPLLKEGKVTNILLTSEIEALIPATGIVMAGGFGKRLFPQTKDKPKPLLEIGGKPIIQYNLERLKKFGIEDINITVRYLGEQIIDYFQDGSGLGCNLSYTKEESALGTLGAVSLIEEIKDDYILLMNSDLLTNIDFADFFNDFIKKGADMAVATIPYEVNIPYAVLELNNERLVSSLNEKPTYTYYSNAGIYLIKKKMLSYIPKGEKHDATDFMKTIIENGHRLISYPIRGYWLDIGKHEDFKKAQKDIEHIKF